MLPSFCSFQIISFILNLFSYHRLVHLFRLVILINCLKLSRSSESVTLSELYGDRKFHISPPLVTVLRQNNPFHSFDFCVFKIHFNVIRSIQGSPDGLLPSVFPTKTLKLCFLYACLPYIPPISLLVLLS
jgi:hypothetical protein